MHSNILQFSSLVQVRFNQNRPASLKNKLQIQQCCYAFCRNRPIDSVTRGGLIYASTKQLSAMSFIVSFHSFGKDLKGVHFPFFFSICFFFLRLSFFFPPHFVYSLKRRTDFFFDLAQFALNIFLSSGYHIVMSYQMN